MVLKVCIVNVITSLNTLVDEYVNTCLVVISEKYVLTVGLPFSKATVDNTNTSFIE